jgi:deazaflavin-dependent oxidoreductase (nitroreductase family)
VSTTDNWNDRIIEEFRANEGRVGGNFAGAPQLPLHSSGAKTGIERVSPIMYRAVDGAFAVFASEAGAPTNPAWLHNLVAHPDASIEVGTRTLFVTARVTSGAERATIWAQQKADYPGFADYEARTTREIPVVILDPVA